MQINSKLNEKNSIITCQQYKYEKFPIEEVLKISLEPFFLIREFFSKFLHIIFVIILGDIIDLKISYCLSANHSPELLCVKFALVLHLNCCALNQSESSYFSCILLLT